MVGDHAPNLRLSAAHPRRRRPRSDRLATGRTHREAVLALAVHLPEGERTLLESLLGEGVPAGAIGKLRGVDARAVNRAAARLVERVRSPEFAVVVTQAAGWPALRRRVAWACVVEATPMRAASRRLGLSVYAVRRELAQVRAITEALRLAGRVPGGSVTAAAAGEARRSA